MLIGIANNYGKEKDKIKKVFINMNYDYIDLDKLINDKFKNEIKNILNDNIKLKINSFVENKISKIKKAKKNVVIDYNKLLDSNYCLDICDYIINIDNNEKCNNLEIKREANKFITYYNEKKYDLLLSSYDDFEYKIKESLEFNFYNNIKITVVVPIFNTGKYLIKCINSIRKQSYKNLEIILINDGSTDNSLKICEYFKEIDDRIVLYDQRNVGLSETRNKGIEYATGEYICFIDSDDYIEKNMLESMLRKILINDDDVCECGLLIHNKDGSIVDMTIKQEEYENISGRLNLINAYANSKILIPAWNKLYKLSSIKDIKFNKKWFKEDTDYIYKLCREGLTFTFVAQPFYHYIKRNDGSLTSKKINRKLFSLIEWAKITCNELDSFGIKYKDASEKILYNSYVHILKYYLRDYNNGLIKSHEYRETIQEIFNEFIEFLVTVNDVGKFRFFKQTIDIINYYINNIVDKDKLISIDMPCIGVLWNSLSLEQKNEIITLLSEQGKIREIIDIDLKDKYADFIKDIYIENHEVDGIDFIKSSTLINQFENNNIIVLNMVIKVNIYMYFSDLKGFQFEKLALIKDSIRKEYKNKISKYAYDNIFHMTMNLDEYELTNNILKDYIDGYTGEYNER